MIIDKKTDYIKACIESFLLLARLDGRDGVLTGRGARETQACTGGLSAQLRQITLNKRNN